jgi:drug/metabolite transporter (DMT)-like permease
LSDKATPPSAGPAAGARLLVLMLGFSWGFNWIATAIALREVPPFSLRAVSTGIGAIALVAVVYLSGRTLRVSARALKHVAVVGLFNIAGFNICSAFSQLSGATSRTIVISYSMPIWTALGTWLILGDRLDLVRVAALGLCVGGLGVLLWPLFASGIPHSALFALGCAFCWTAATIYLKWADIGVDPLVNTAWQLVIGTAVIAVGMVIADGYPRVWPIAFETIAWIIYIGVLGTGLAHFLWWTIVGKLPTTTAALGSLLVPVVGVVASTVILGERPTVNDMIGFAMILGAAACVLLQPGAGRVEVPE